MTEVPIFSVVPHRCDQTEGPGYRNAGALFIDDHELRITTTWWNWSRHMALPLGLLTTDLGNVFSGPRSSRSVVLTLPWEGLESVRLWPDREPWPRAQIDATRAEDGCCWRCTFSYSREHAAAVDEIRKHVRPEVVAEQSASPARR